jgi:hypothetical protein
MKAGVDKEIQISFPLMIKKKVDLRNIQLNLYSKKKGGVRL